MPFDALVVFAKVPQPGKVKTRLGSSIGPERAALLCGLFLRYLSWRLKRLPAGLRLFIAVDPPGGLKQIHRYFAYFHRPSVFPQKGRDLGARMLKATAEVKRRGARKVLLIGSDCLELSVGLLRRGLKLLDRKDMVLGSAKDGGYYLLGWKEPLAPCLESVAWSTPEVFRQTATGARKAGFTVGVLPVLADVDEPRDLRRLSRRIDARNPAAGLLRKQLSAVLSAVKI